MRSPPSVETCQHRVCRAHVISEKTINRQSGSCVGCGGHALVHSAANPVLGTEQRHKFHPRRMRKQINRASSPAVHSSLVCDQPDALPGERRKLLRLKDVDPR